MQTNQSQIKLPTPKKEKTKKGKPKKIEKRQFVQRKKGIT